MTQPTFDLDQDAGYQALCTEHMEWYWSEDCCPVCADEAKREDLTTGQDKPFDVPEEYKWQECLTTGCKKKAWWEDGYCSDCVAEIDAEYQ